jgi:RHS repeat-associated protein
VTFAGRAGHRLSWTQSGSVGIYDTLLYGPSGGNALANCGYSCAGGSAFLEPVTLPADGTYTVFFGPRYYQTGTWTITLYDVPPDAAGTLPLNGSVSLSITTPGQNASATLTGYAGGQLTISSSGSTISLYNFTLYDPNNNTVGSGSYSNPSLNATLTVSGTYRVLFNPSYYLTGTAKLSYSSAAVPSSGLTIGVGSDGRGTHARTATRLVAEPVNSLTGAFTDSVTDLSLPGVGLPFSFSRSYTSIDATQGRLGLAWTDSYSASLTVQGSGDVVLHGEDGQQVSYTKQADGSFVGAAGALSKLSAVGGGYQLVRADQVVYAFDSQGRLTSMKDRNNRALAFAYNGNGQLATITDTASRQITLVYNASGLLSRVAVPDGRSVSFGYTGNLLTSVMDVTGGTTAYTYDSGNRLASIVDQNGHTQIRNTYGPDGRVSQQLDALGAQTLFGWDSATQTEAVTDARGNVWTDVYQSNVLFKRIDPLGNVTEFGFDSSLDETSVTGPNGTTVNESYDANGYLTQASAAALHATKTFTYDLKNDLTSVTDARGKVTSYAYDSLGNRTAVAQDGQTVFQYTYDAKGLPTSATDGRGGRTTYAYDSLGNLVSTTDPLGGKTTFAYDSAGRFVSRADPLGNATLYAYDAAGRPISETDPLGGKTSYGYDAAGNRTSVTDASGHRTGFAYDAANRLLAITASGGGVTSYTYDAVGNRVTVTDPDGNTTTSAYDAENRLASTTSPLGEKTVYGYDANGNRASLTDPRGKTTTYSYDAAGRLLAETDPLGGVTAYRYDEVGNQIGATDALVHTTTYAYDARGRLLSARAPDGATTTYAYDANGNLVARTDPSGKTWTRTYDAEDRLTSEITPLGEKTSYRYDAAGNLTAIVDPRGNVSGADGSQYTTTNAYDGAGRLVQVTDPLGGTTAYAYDAVGNRTSSTDANGHRTSHAYDAANRLLSVTAPDSSVTSYSYDPAGNLLSRVDPNHRTTTYAYDADNRRTTVTSPLGQKWTSAYDPSGNLSKTVAPNGNATAIAGDGTTTYAYDAAGRLTTIGYSDSTPGVAFTYDAAGNRTAMTDGSGTVSYRYDAANRLTQATRGADTFAYSYDPAGNVKQRTYPGGTTVSSTYDDDGRLAGVVSGGLATSYAYDPSGRVTQVALPNGYAETRMYDRGGRLTESKSAKGTSVLADLKVTLNPVGNPTLVARTGTAPATIAYAYDSLDRLTSVCFKASCPKAGDPFIRWTYDAVGNRLTESRSNGSTSYAYNAADELVSAGATTYTYDQNGNQLSAGGRTFAYDLANRLVSTTSGSATTTYRYDGDGMRLEATTGSQGSQKTAYLWDPNGRLPELAVERDGSGALLRRYVYGLSRISMTTPAGSFYYHYDNVGSVTNVTSSSAKTQWTELYEPFGAVRTETKNDGTAPANPMKFAGEYLDPTRLYDLRAREYDPTTGRFLGLDPLRGSGEGPAISAYVYADDSPTVLADPSGMGPIALGSPATSATRDIASIPSWVPCIDGRSCIRIPPFSSPVWKRALIVNAARLGWRRRDEIHYASRRDGTVWRRMQGVRERIYPPRVPNWEDCSSFATWTFFVAGAPDPNGSGYNGIGYTGTLAAHGHRVGAGNREDLALAKPGDLVFYGNPVSESSHVAIYVGNGQAIGHGREQAPDLTPVDYRPDRSEIRSYFDD